MNDEDKTFTNLSRGHLHPKNESGLEGEVPGEVVKDDAESSAFGEVEETKDSPICQPLEIICMIGRLKCLEGQEGREGPSEKVGHGLCNGVYKDKEDECGSKDHSTVCLGDLSPLFDLVDNWVLGELQED